MSDFTAQRANIPTITQSLAVGNIEKTGSDARTDGSFPFNDAEDPNGMQLESTTVLNRFSPLHLVGNWPYFFNIDKTHPLEKINVQFRTNYVDGLTVTYRLLNDGTGQSGSSSAIQHGAKFTATESSQNTVTFAGMLV
jgi:hypothetical protein